MSSNRSKNTKRLSLRKNKIAKSPISKKNRTHHTSLGLPTPGALSLNTNCTASNHSTISNRKLPRPKSAHLSSSNAAIQNVFENAYIKPKSWKKSMASALKHTPITPMQNITIEDDEEDDLAFMMNPPSVNTDNLSGSSISDILCTIGSLHEDSDDEAATKAMFSKLDHLNIGSRRHKSTPMRKIQSNPVISTMLSPDTATSLFSHQNAPKIETVHIKPHTTHNIHQKADTSPSSEDKESVYLPSQSSKNLRSRSHSMSSNLAMDGDDEHSSISGIKSVPETNAIIKNHDGLMTYITNNNNQPLLPLQTRTRRANPMHHRSFSSLKDKRIKQKQKKKKRKSCRTYNELGYRQENMLKREFLSDLYENDHQREDNNRDRVSDDNSNNECLNRGVKCSMKLGSEWDCLTVSSNQEWVALFSRNSMTLLKITEYGTFEQLRDLKAGRKDSRLKYGAVDAQFYYNDACKLVSCTRSGTLIVLNLNFAGRGCVALTKCPLKQRVHKVTWIRDTECCLAAAEDGKCYLWDTRCDPNHNNCSSFNSSSSALSVRTSPFNDQLFASSHKNGTLSVWDIRNDSSPFLTMTAHKSSINCIDWHPAIPNVIASCGYRDITIKIWNLTDDDIAQRRYYDYCSKMNMTSYSKYNCEDDYRLGQEITSPALSAVSVSSYHSFHSSLSSAQCIPNNLKPNCAMYPSGHVSQIGWRPCNDPRSLSANQIACSYVGSEQVVEMWDIKSSYVPVASLSSHESETKFRFIHRSRAFRDDMTCREYDTNSPRTYIITCSKDKSTKLTDCGFADIPRSKLSSCALDIAPFGSTCFVSVPRQKLHPFDCETYKHDDNCVSDIISSSSCSSDEQDTESLRKSLQSSSCGELRNNNELFLSVPIQRKAHRSFSENKKIRSMTSAISSDSEAPSSTRSVSMIFSTLFRSTKKTQSIKTPSINHESINNDINAMSGGFKQSKIMQLTDIFNHVDAFSEFETKLTCYPLSEASSLSPCDCAATFKYLAKHYKLNGKSIVWLCQQNEMVSRYIGNAELQTLWNLLGVLLKNVLSSNNNCLPAISSPNNNNIHIIYHEHEQETDDDLSNSNDDDDWWMDHNNNTEYISSASNHSYLSIHSTTDHNEAHTPPLKQLEYALHNDDYGIKNDDGEAAMVASYIKDVLLENIDRGDIQTAVTIIVMLDKYITQYLSQQEIADIVLSYLDLLLHSRLLIEAVKVYDLTKHYPLIEKYFLSSHRLIIKCIRCKDPMRDYRCFKCGKCARCSQCNEELINNKNNTVLMHQPKLLQHPKLLIWCQICGHGGHFDHMSTWFNNKSICCVDSCDHECQPVLIAIEDNIRL